LVNAIAHRDYSDEGRGIEIYIFNDRIEIRNPGGLLSPMTVDDLKAMKGAHQSRNSYVARTLREIGYMRELGEGMRRIHELMKSNELAPPKIQSDGELFSLSLFHRAMYSQDEILWLEQYSSFALSAEQKAIVLLGRRGELVAPQAIWDRLGLVDTEHYRRLVYSLQVLGILESGSKQAAKNMAERLKVSVRSIPRFRIKLAKDVKPRSGRNLASQPAEDTTERVETTQTHSRAKDDQNTSIFVGNLPPNVSDRDMITTFGSFGVVEKVYVPKRGSLSRGYGFIEFESADSARKLLREQPKIMMGPYRLRVGPPTPRIKS
jgi:ATP-dependent DNA helicase RecG